MSEEMNESDKKEKNGFLIELGDLIQIHAPTNSDIHEEAFFVTYVDSTKIKLLNINSYELNVLTIDENDMITDESITEIHLLSRSEESGYARQNGLATSQWIDIYFNGETPYVATGQITNLEEDMIEITTNENVFYIDFEYKGIPEHIPIEKIVLREPPREGLNLESGEIYESPVVNKSDEEASIVFTDTGESIITIPENTVADENIRDKLHSIYLDANELFGEDLGEIIQVVELPESQKRYGIDIQLTDLTDELLSTIPNNKRSATVMNKIHNLVQRFKELRELYSNHDENGNITGKKVYGDFYKPLVNRILNLDTKLRWLIPVVSNKRNIYKVYDDETIIQSGDDTNGIASYKELVKNIEKPMNEYYDKTVDIDVSKYEELYSKLDREFTVFTPPTNKEEFLIFNKEIKTDLECIVNNYGQFNSTVISKETNNVASFLIQKYNMGIQKLKSIEMKNGKKFFLRDNLMKNDKASIKSFIVMPEPVIRYSQVDLPGTNILMRSQLSQHSLQFFRFLKKGTDIAQHVVSDLKTEIDYYNVDVNEENIRMEDDTRVHFLSKMTEYILDDTLNEEWNKGKDFVNAIIPKTRTMIRIFRKYISEKLTVVDIIKTLEPFMIYSENITYGQFKEIRAIINKQIEVYNTKKKENILKFTNIKDNINKLIISNRKGINHNKIKTMLDEKFNIKTQFLEDYKLDKKEEDGYNESPSEVLYNIMSKDNNKLYSTLITYMLLSLITPNELIDSLEKPELKDMNTVNDKSCIRRYLAKKYSSVGELEKDNIGNDIYYDSEYDDTPYSILGKYKDDQNKMLPDKFIKFLAENLVQKHECPRTISLELANTLILGKKKVSDGEYAVIEFKPKIANDLDETKLSENEKKGMEIESTIKTYYKYYVRKHGHWVHDPSIGEESFMDTNSLFCNIDYKCYKNPAVQACESTDSAEIRMKKMLTKKAVQEFDKRYSISVEELKTTLEKNIIAYSDNIRKSRILAESSLYRENNIEYSIGKYANNEAVVVSPFTKLRDLILSQDDFSKKQHDICRFVEEDHFCRSPVEENKEDMLWAYCIETDTKLFPLTLYALAETYVSGGNYTDKLNEICAKYGALSDDGDSVVDKHSGYILKKIDFINEDTYDEQGFKIVTDSVIEKDLGITVAEILKKRESYAKKVFENEISSSIHNVFQTLCTYLAVDPEPIETFVMNKSVELITDPKIVLTEKAYAKKQEKLNEKQIKKLDPYPIYKNQSIIMFVGSIMLVALQTIIPSLKAFKTFPGCTRSFEGFPLDGNADNKSGLTYIVCIIHKIKSSISPWDSIQHLKKDKLEDRMLYILQNQIVVLDEIKELYLKKREYTLLNPDEFLPEEHQISKWKHFLPPVVPFTVGKNIHGISKDFNDETISLIGRANSQQRTHIDMYKSKTLLNSYAVIESINSIVASKDLLLKSVGKVPFLQNACCNENDKSTHPFSYFKSEDPNIDIYVKRSAENEKMVDYATVLSRPSILFNDEKTGFEYPVIPANVFEQNIYKAFIHYCNFDNEVPIPDELLTVCREKIDGYNKNASIEEKMDFLKKNGKRLTENDLKNLMKIVNSRNGVDINAPLDFSPVSVLRDFIEHMDSKNSNLIEQPLRKCLMDIIDKYDPRKMIFDGDVAETPFNKATTKLRNYLIKTNQKMQNEILKFINQYGNLDPHKYTGIQIHIMEIMKWNIDRSVKDTGFEYDDALYRITQFVKTSIHSIIKIYPNIILNDVNNTTVHSHWRLSEKHLNDIRINLTKYMDSGINSFKGNKLLTRFLLHLQTWTTDVLLFIQSIPIFTPVARDGNVYNALFSKNTLYLLYSYCWYSTLYEFIQNTDDPELLQLEIQDSKQKRRSQINELNDPVNDVTSIITRQMGDEAEDILDIEIISGNKTDLKRDVCSLLICFLNMEKKQKALIDKPYENITKLMKKTKKQEKDSITAYFEDIKNKDDRQIENQLKNLHLGQWNVGNELFKYKGSDYNKNREANLGRLFNETEAAGNIFDTEPGQLDINDLDRLDDLQAVQDHDNEGYDITGLGEEYDEGDYYGEEREEEY